MIQRNKAGTFILVLLGIALSGLPGDERGRYLYPEVYGRSKQESIWYAISPNARYLIDHPEALERPGQ